MKLAIKGHATNCIKWSCGTVDTNNITCNKGCILSFPIKEMRNTFYDKFKDLIENCKKLL